MTSVQDISPSTPPSSPKYRGWLRWILLGALSIGTGALAQLYWIFFARLTYPLDIEWMEGGMLVHAHRIMHGQALYAPPSVNFVSFLYTPLYPALLAIMGQVVGLSYVLGRLLSIIGFTAALAAILAAAWQRTTDRLAAAAAGLLAAAAVAMAFPFCGSWYDLVRNDSLWLGFTAWSLVLLTGKEENLVRVASASALMVAAFFTKQTAGPMALAAGIGLLLTGRWRRALWFGLLTAVPAVLLVLLANHLTEGWFWIYIYKLHQSHPVFWNRIWPKTPMAILTNQWPIWVTLLSGAGFLTWKKRLDADILFWILAALAGLAAAAVGSATQGAYKNANIPGVFFPAMAAGAVLASTMEARWQESDMATKRLAPLLLAAIFALQAPLHWFNPRPMIPTRKDRIRASRFIALLKSFGPNPFVPYHPYYNIIAGGQGHMHIMGVNDVASWAKGITSDEARNRRIKADLRRSIYESFRRHRWTAVFHDRTYTHQLFGMTRFYRRSRDLGTLAPEVWTGNRCRPRYLWLPR